MVDAEAAAYEFDEMSGIVERVGDDLESWLWWCARDVDRAQPCPPGPTVVDDAVQEALRDVETEPQARFGASNEADLLRLLDELGVAAAASLRDAEQRFGGLVTRWIRLGPFQMLRDPSRIAQRTLPHVETPLVLVGEMHEGHLCLGSDGAVWRRPKLGRGPTPQVASSLDGWIERASLVHGLCERAGLRIVLGGVESRRLAASLGLGERAGRLFAGDSVVLLEGCDPFDVLDDEATIAYVADTSEAAKVVESVGELGGQCRVASAPWVSTWPGVLRSLEDTEPPVLARLRRVRTPVVTTQRHAEHEAPSLSEGVELLPQWPHEHGVVRRVGNTIEQLRCADGRVVSVQRFEASEELAQLYVGQGATWIDPRWSAPAGHDDPFERRHGGRHWEGGWLGPQMAAWWGLRSPRPGLRVVGEDGRGLILQDDDGCVWRTSWRPHGGIWHRGFEPHPVGSVDDLTSAL